MRGKDFRLGERVVVLIDGSQHTGSINRRVDEAGKHWQVILDDGGLYEAIASDIKRHREKYVDPTPEEIAERAAAIRDEWPEQLARQRQVIKPEPLELSESRLWRRTSEGGLAE